jgi:hypothetical protein
MLLVLGMLFYSPSLLRFIHYLSFRLCSFS